MVAWWGVCVVVPGGHAWLLWGVCMVAPGGACVVAPRGAGVCEVAPGRRGHARLLGGVHCCSWGACVVALGGMQGFSGGHAWFFRGACMVFSMRYGQWASGTHPTGMHSFYWYQNWCRCYDRSSVLFFSYTATVAVSNKVGRVTSQPIQVIVQSPISDVTIEQIVGEPVVGYSVSSNTTSK